MVTVIVLTASLAAGPVTAPASPTATSAAEKYSVTISAFQDSGHYLWAYIRNAETGEFLRYIPVCLERIEDSSQWDTRSCHNTDDGGRVEWLLYAGRIYRLAVPATTYHYARYSSPFVG